MPRKIAIVLAALIIPGGLVALCGALILKQLQRSERGRRALAAARSRVPGWVGTIRPPAFGQRQAA